MRACIEGKPPPSAVERHAEDKVIPAIEAFAKRYPREILESIDWAMQVSPEKRPEQAGELRDAMLGRIPVPKHQPSEQQEVG